MKHSELNVGVEYAVIPSWTYSSKSAMDIDKVRENDVVKAVLLSADKYEYEASQRSSDPTSFKKAEAGNRSVGVLVKATDKNGSDVYWTSRLTHIVAPYAVLEPKWQKAKQDEEAKEREQNEIRNRVKEHQARVSAEVERSRNSVINTAKELLGATSDVEVDTRGYELEYRGVVNLSISEFELLVELAYQGKSAVA
jgi:hypothetical protein